MSDHEIALLGAPDSLLGTRQSTAKPVQVVQLDMTNDMLEELLDCVRSGKPPQILFGASPSIRYDGKSRALQAGVEKFRNELYCTTEDGNEEWSFAGVINHSLSLPEAKSATAGMDHALETLKSRVAAEKMERENNKPLLRASDQSGTKNKLSLNRSSHLSALHKPTSLKSASNLASSPSYLSPSRSAAVDDTMFEAANHPSRQPIVHLLAAEPKTFDEIGRQVFGPTYQKNSRFPVFKKLWPLVAQPVRSDDPDGSHTLINKVFKEVKPFEFSGFADHPELREKAVENAIRAFDRMRLAKTDPIWQQLLPVEERGKGICLSKLNLLAPHVRTPVMAPDKFNKKSAAAKKADAKKGKKADESDKEKVSPEKPKKPVGEKERPKAIGKDSLKVTGKDSPRVNGKNAGTPLARSVKVAERTTGTKDASARADEAITTLASKTAGMNKPANSPLQKASKPSTSAKSLLNKPKNPSPLSRSPPVNASDFRDDHPVHKKLAAAVSPSRNPRRRADSDIDVPAKRSHITSTSSSASSVEKPKPKKPTANGATERARDHPTTNRVDSPNPASLKRKAALADLDSDSSTKRSSASSIATGAVTAPNKARKTLPGSSARPHPPQKDSSSSVHHTRADKTPPSTSSDMDDDAPIRLTWKQAVDAALRFERYYPKYKRRWEELCTRDAAHPPSREEKEQFMVMHRRVEDMKRQIREAVARGKDGGGEFE